MSPPPPKDLWVAVFNSTYKIWEQQHTLWNLSVYKISQLDYISKMFKKKVCLFAFFLETNNNNNDIAIRCLKTLNEFEKKLIGSFESLVW